MDINHPISFMNGLRVLQLVGRPKDGAEKRSVLRVSPFGQGSFQNALEELNCIRRPNERIYASAVFRNIDKAIQMFRFKQLNAEYNGQLYAFYDNIEARWVSSLMQKECAEAEDKMWLIDCDSAAESKQVDIDLPIDCKLVYSYYTKNGVHKLIKPYNRQNLSALINEKLDTNPLMLWSY